MFAESREAQIMFAAQHMADSWRRDKKRGAFAQAATRECTAPWLQDAFSPREQRAFIAAADLARVGQGHALTNPDPLMRAIERQLHTRYVPVLTVLDLPTDD